MYNFSNEALAAAGVTADDIEFYRNARIAYNDSLSWQRVIRIQHATIAHQEAK